MTMAVWISIVVNAALGLILAGKVLYRLDSIDARLTRVERYFDSIIFKKLD
jgi:hypothetical protein